MTGLETAGGLKISEGTLSRNILLRRESEPWSCLEENRKNRKKKTCFQKAGRAIANPFYIRASIDCWGMMKSYMRLTGRKVKKNKRQERRSVESGRASEVIERTIGCFHPREVVQSLSHVQLFVTPWTASRQAFLSFTISQSLLKLMSIALSSNHLIACCLLLLSSNLPSIKVSSNESAVSIRCPNYWSFSTNTSVQVFQHQSFQWIFRMDSL